jgi:hypothetical protein
MKTNLRALYSGAMATNVTLLNRSSPGNSAESSQLITNLLNVGVGIKKLFIVILIYSENYSLQMHKSLGTAYAYV